MCCFIGVISTAEAQDFTYTTNSGAITITKYIGSGGAVTITNIINGLPVKSIGVTVFEDCTSLTSVTIPHSVTNIGRSAFDGCLNLTSVTIGTNVVDIGDMAFAWCWNLPNITIPSRVASLGEKVFLRCDKLTNVTIPRSLVSAGYYPFWSCKKLTAITVDSLNPVYCSSNGVWFNKNMTSLVEYPAGKVGSYTIPSSVTSIAYSAFAYSINLDRITIPGSVTSIDMGTFYYCTGLTNIFFTGNAPSPPASDAFVNVNATVYYLPGTTGWGSTYGGFQTALWQDVPGYIYGYNGKIIISQYTGSGGSVVIPSTIHGIQVTSIGSNAFSFCTNMNSIVIPNSCTNIGNSAFSSCSNLTSIYFKGNAPSIGSGVFTNANNVTVYYLQGKTGWGSSFSGLPTAQWCPIISGDGRFGVRTNIFGFNINWSSASGLVVVVEACTNLTNSSWSQIQSNTLTSDAIIFNDTNWTNYPNRYYRITSP